MDHFDKLIKQKVEQFDVPYNEAHWAEMDKKLNTIKVNKIKWNLFASITTILIIGVASYMYVTNNQQPAVILNPKNNANNIIVQTEKKQEQLIPKVEQKAISQNNTKINKNILPSENIKEADQEKTIVSTATEKTPIQTSKKPSKEESTSKLENNTVIPSAEFIVFNNRVCQTEEVSFEANERLFTVSYHWDFGDGNTSKEKKPTHRYKESGKYDVELTITDKKTGIKYKHIENNAVIILPQPSAKFTYSETSLKHDDNKLKYPYTQFYNKNISSTNSYTWSFGNGETSTSSNPKVLYHKKGSFKTVLTVKNEYGCYASFSKDVFIKNTFDLYAPNAFTPNHSGENDYFIPKALLGWGDVQFQMTITDKSNKEVYKTSDRNEPWNGKFNNTGSILPTGIYFWKVITYDAEGRTHQHAGKINLLE